MIKRLVLLAVTGALMVALAATAAFTQEENGNGDEQERCFLPEGCEISADDGDETIYGGIGPDYIVGGAGNDVIYGLGNDDWLDGGAGNDLVRGGDGNDLVDGGTGNDTVVGGAGNDYVTGYLGTDTLYGGPGHDYIYAADGTVDEVFGGPGYDVCVVDVHDLGNIHGCEEVYIQ